MTARTGGQVLVDQIARHGVRRAFCVPGESYLAVLDAFYDASVELIPCRHEGGAAYMAEAHGKLTSGPGVVFVTRGPGAANAMAGVGTADYDGTPLVLFVGLIPRRHRYLRAFQEIDLAGLFGSMAKLVETIDDAARIPEQVARAFAVATSGRPGPVVIGLPEDMLTDIVDVPDAAPVVVPDGAVGDADLGRLTRLLNSARRPVVLLGGNRWTSEAVDQIGNWLKRWSLPAVADFRCQDHIDNESPSYIGRLGFGRDDSLAQFITAADLIITVGTAIGDTATDGFQTIDPLLNPPVVQVTPYPDLTGTAYRPSLHILASPAAFAQAVTTHCPGAQPPWRAETNKARNAYLQHRTPIAEGDDLDLGKVFELLSAHLPPGTLVTMGAGNYTVWPQRFLSYRHFPAQLGPRNGAMGYSVPAGVAAALEYPGRQVLAVAGDGCFLMNGQELATAVAAQARLLTLVINNSRYGTIRMHQENHYPGRPIGTELTTVDFAGYARSLGAHGETVTHTEDFEPALVRALETGGPTVIDLRITSGRLAPGRLVPHRGR
jgi:acetolactate synthase-1/2/3 large subunit